MASASALDRASAPNRVRELRTARYWSQDRLARKARLNWSTVSRIERGERNPGAVTRRRIADALGVPVDLVFPEVPEEATA